MLKKITLAAAVSTLTLSAVAAADGTMIDKTHELTDGSTVYVYMDGKMAMEDRLGRAFVMEEGQIMVTKNGQKLKMTGNEIYRVEKQYEMYRGG